MQNIPFFCELHKCDSFFFTVVSKYKKSTHTKKFVLTFLQLLVRNFFSLSAGTKPVCGESLGVSSFPQRRKSTLQIMYNFLIRQSDVQTADRIPATRTPWDTCYSQPDWVESSASLPLGFFGGVWLWAVTGCGYLSTIQPWAAQSAADLCVP